MPSGGNSKHEDRDFNRDPALNEPLVVRESALCFTVAPVSAPTDWLVSFDKRWGRQAKEWAERVAYLHNETLRRGARMTG